MPGHRGARAAATAAKVKKRATYDSAFKLHVVKAALQRPPNNRIKPTCSLFPGIEPCQVRHPCERGTGAGVRWRAAGASASRLNSESSPSPDPTRRARLTPPPPLPLSLPLVRPPPPPPPTRSLCSL